MELHAENLFALDCRHEWSTIIAQRSSEPIGGALVRRQVVGVREVNEGCRRDTFEQAAARCNLQLIPPHVRHLTGMRESFRKAADGAAENSETLIGGGLLAAFIQGVHAEADAQ